MYIVNERQWTKRNFELLSFGGVNDNQAFQFEWRISMEHFQTRKTVTPTQFHFILFCFVLSLRRSFRFICGIGSSASFSLWFICRFSLGFPEMAILLPPIKWSWIGRSVGRSVVKIKHSTFPCVPRQIYC